MPSRRQTTLRVQGRVSGWSCCCKDNASQPPLALCQPGHHSTRGERRCADRVRGPFCAAGGSHWPVERDGGAGGPCRAGHLRPCEIPSTGGLGCRRPRACVSPTRVRRLGLCYVYLDAWRQHELRHAVRRAQQLQRRAREAQTAAAPSIMQHHQWRVHATHHMFDMHPTQPGLAKRARAAGLADAGLRQCYPPARLEEIRDSRENYDPFSPILPPVAVYLAF